MFLFAVTAQAPIIVNSGTFLVAVGKETDRAQLEIRNFLSLISSAGGNRLHLKRFEVILAKQLSIDQHEGQLS